MKTSCGEYILLLNNEVVVTDGWLSGMLECHKYEPNAGIVGPMSNHGSGPQQIIDDDYHTPDNLDKFAYNFRERYRHRRIPHRNIDGFCMLFHRTLPENIGLFDERFETGQCEEEDFCLRTALAGHRNCIAGDVFILSNGGRVFPNQGNKTVRKPFEQKWTLNAQSPDGKRLAVLKASELANDLCQRGQTDKAIEVLIDCIKISPDSADIYYELARILIESKRFSEAWEVVGSMPETIKNELKTIEVAGYAKEGLGSDDEASTYVDKMLALNDQYPAALNLNGILAYKTGENEKAAGYFRKAADADPGYGEARINLGILQWAAGKQDEGLEHLERGFILAPLISDHSSAYYTAITSLGSFAEAESTLRSARGLYPNNKNLVFLYIDDLIQQGKWGPAMLEIEDALIAFGLDEGTLNAALAVRDNLGPLQIDKTSKKVTLSLCMIVKNEERYLANCLHSVRDIVDEIIIVDTGSTDKTIDIAKVFGAQVFEFPWTGDFSAARNQSLARASGDWILVLDADEVISGIDHRRFLELIDRGNGRQPAFTITTRNYLERPGTAGWTENDGSYPQEEKGIGWFGSDKVRLFRNNSLIRFENPVHELLEASLKRAGVPIKKCDIPIHHYGRLDRDKLLAKGKDYYLLGRKKLEERGDGDYVALRELAIQAGELGIFDEAADLWQQALSVRPDDVDALFNLGYNYLQIGKYLEASHASRRAVELSPDTKDAVLNYALSEMFLGNAPKATTLLEKSLSKEEENPVLMAVLGASSLINGDNEKGLAIFKKLKEKQINPAAYMNSLLEQLVKSGQIDYFVRLIDAAISNNITDRETLRRQITPTLNKIAREFQSNGKADKALIILNASVEKKLNNEETGKLLGALRTI